MQKIIFGPEEEKLAIAFDHIVALEEGFALLAQRCEIDSLIIGQLLDASIDPIKLREQWRQLFSTYYPNQTLRNMNSQHSAALAEGLNHRLNFWMKQIETKCSQLE